MSVFDPTQVVVLLNGVQISDFGEKGDAIELKPGVPAGNYTMGVTGKGTFVLDPDKSATLTLNLQQHSPDNRWLNQQKALQRGNIRAFIPFTLEIRDLLNEDLATAQRGYFTELPGYARGTSAKNTVWTIVFENHDISLEKGYGN